VANIHPTAVIDPRAEIASSVTIGPFCVVEGDVAIQSGCRLASHVMVKSGTVLGENNTVYEGSVLGGRPQHLRAGERVGRLKVGNGNTVRENVTMHVAVHEDAYTVVGHNNFLMVNVHIAHDCQVGDNVIIANNAMLAGHVVVESRAYVSGAVGVHQFCRIGQMAMVGGQAHITRDVPPYVTVDGLSSLVVGLNRIGLRRNGLTDQDMVQLKAAYRVIYRSALRWSDILATLRRQFPLGPAAAFYEFLRDGERGFVQERRGPPKSTIRIFDEEGNVDPNARVRPAI
jgi:UDP-N-acetylglucosamine acyltransferase